MGAMNQSVLSLGLMPNGDVVAGGLFTLPTTRLARWNGSTWTGFGTGMNNAVWSLAVQEGGELVAGGSFTSAGGVPAFVIARWDGTTWSAPGSGLAGGNVQALEVRPGGELLVGGAFTTAGGEASQGLAIWATPALRVSQQPMSTDACTTGDASFSVAASGTGLLNYQWQAELAPAIWTDLADGELVYNSIVLCTANGALTDTPVLGSLSQFLEDRSMLGLRCRIADECDTAFSNTSVLTVWPAANGDANSDGQLDGLDIQTFVDFVLLGNPDTNTLCACDFTGDGVLDIADVQDFVNRLIANA